jgi:hypothetical protein
MFRSLIAAGVVMSAITLIAVSSGPFAGSAHADDPVGNSLDGLDAMRGVEIGDLSHIADPTATRTSPPPQAAAPASRIEMPTGEGSGAAAVGDVLPTNAVVPSGSTKHATLQLTATGGGGAAAATSSPMIALAIAVTGIACFAASRGVGHIRTGA